MRSKRGVASVPAKPVILLASPNARSGAKIKFLKHRDRDSETIYIYIYRYLLYPDVGFSHVLQSLSCDDLNRPVFPKTSIGCAYPERIGDRLRGTTDGRWNWYRRGPNLLGKRRRRWVLEKPGVLLLPNSAGPKSKKTQLEASRTLSALPLRRAVW